MENNYRPRSRIKRRIISIGIVILLIISIVYFVFGNSAKIASVSLGSVDYQDFSRSFFVNAELEPVQEQNIELPAGAKIKEVYVKEGDKVERNAKLLLLDTTEWSKEKAKLEAELTDLEKSLAEQPELSGLLGQTDLLAGLDLQKSLLNSFSSSFQLPDFSALQNLSLSQILGDQNNYQQLMTLLDRAVYLTEQVQNFTNQIQQMLDLLTNFEPSQELVELLRIFKQQLEILNELQKDILEFLRFIIDKCSESEECADIVEWLNDWYNKAAENQAMIEDLIDRIEKWLEGISSNISTSESGITEQDSTKPDAIPDVTLPDQTNPDATDNIPNISPPSQSESGTQNRSSSESETTSGNEIGFSEEIVPHSGKPGIRLIPGNGGQGLVGNIGVLDFTPLFMTNLGLSNLNQDLQSVLQQSGMLGLDMADQLEKQIAELDFLVKTYSEPVKAEFDGLIVELNVEAKQEIEQDSIALRVFSENELVAVYHANKRDAGLIDIGQKVIYDYEDLELSGEVIYKSPIAKSNNSSLSSNSMSGMDFSMFGSISETDNFLSGGNTVMIKMSIEGEDLDQVIIGFDIDCEIVVEEVDRVLSIPAEALWMENEQSFVYTVEDSKLVKTLIETGLQGAEFIEVKDGLSEADSVVLNPRAQYKEGQKVKINE